MQNLHRLLDIMVRLRDPESGCPWDLRQDSVSLAPYTIEEAYELVEAAERGDPDDLCEELGDLLLQVVFHARIAEEREWFDFDTVAGVIGKKLIRRHPHVFGETSFASDEERQRHWEASKQAERRERGKSDPPPSVLGELPRGLPALMSAQKLQKRAARQGFDWPAIEPVFEKLHEELDELKAACQARDAANIHEEIGDLLFVIANIARHLEVDAESSLRGCNEKFIRRFRHIERQVAAAGGELTDYTLAELDGWWDEAKRIEKGLAPGNAEGALSGRRT